MDILEALKVCSVEGCGKPVHVKLHGLCNGHYQRWQRHGDPLGGRTPKGEPERFYREVVMAYEGDECLTWPFSRNDRGCSTISLNGKILRVSRRLCEEVNGPPPTPKHEAAHSCGHGHLACVTKRHLSWKTGAENSADKILHGTSNRGERNPVAKMTESQILQIIALKGSATQREIADRFGVHPSTIGGIHNRKSWAWLANEMEGQ